jgi:hypothetical protein
VNVNQTQSSESTAIATGLPNGSGAAALLAAGVGAFVLAVLAVIADHVAAFKSLMIFYKPTGPLSGVTSSAIIVWLVLWATLDARWRQRTVALRGIVTVALVLLALGLMLTFPPVGDLF